MCDVEGKIWVVSDKDTYTEKAIDEAIKKVNASKKAEQTDLGLKADLSKALATTP